MDKLNTFVIECTKFILKNSNSNNILKYQMIIPKFIKKVVIYTSILVLISLLLLYFKKWPTYLLHIITHQLYIYKNQIDINELNISQISPQIDLTKKEKEKIKLIQIVKEYGKRQLNLQDSKRYTKIVFLPRKQLGWFITISPEFSFIPYRFQIPFISSFSYIGFFNKKLLQKWKIIYEQQGYEIYTSVIGGYNTLGFFEDPIFSTYLFQSTQYLLQIILHEMVHEKIWIANETSLNEKVATFLAKKMVDTFLKQRDSKFQHVYSLVEKKILKNEKKNFWLLFQKMKKKLNSLYLEKIKPEHKRMEKSKIITEFKRELIKMKLNNKFFTYLPQRIVSSDEINNAMFIQIERYSHESNVNLLENIFSQKCTDNILCFIQEIEIMSLNEKSLNDLKNSFR